MGIRNAFGQKELFARPPSPSGKADAPPASEGCQTRAQVGPRSVGVRCLWGSGDFPPAFHLYFVDHAPCDYHDPAVHHDFDLDSRGRVEPVQRGAAPFALLVRPCVISLGQSERDMDQTRDKPAQAPLRAGGVEGDP